MSLIVVLNGTSSSGKTSIARAFQELALPRVFLNISIDSILYALPESVVGRLEAGDSRADPRLVRGFYACVSSLASHGLDLVIDHAITSEAEASMLREAVAGHDAVMVGLDCPVEVLVERERARGNRRPGMAAAQCERVHQWVQYHLRIDTSQISVEDAARRIVEVLPSAD
jgi:chloramphenicol 3-O phosphotransferase